MKKYFNLKMGKPDVNGEVIAVDMLQAPDKRLYDFINSYAGDENNLRFTKIRSNQNYTSYDVTIPNMEFSAGGGPTAVSPAAPAGWNKRGDDVVRLALTNDGQLRSQGKAISKQGLEFFIDEISESKAKKLKQDEFNYSMQQLWIAGA